MQQRVLDALANLDPPSDTALAIRGRPVRTFSAIRVDDLAEAYRGVPLENSLVTNL